MKARLQVLICTCGENAMQKIEAMRLPEVQGVEYLVSWQTKGGKTTVGRESILSLTSETFLSRRPDIRVFPTDSQGLSNNRNDALTLASAPYVLIADDDLHYTAASLLAVIEAFDAHPEIDIATFRSITPNPAVYPPGEHDLAKPFKNYNITSFEIALRLESVKREGLRFSPLWGIGAPYLHAGEENVFILQALRKGLKGRFFPIDLVHHPDVSTGYRKATPGVMRAAGAYTMARYPFVQVPIRILLKAYRTPGNRLVHLLHLFQGAAYYLRHPLS